MSVNAVPGSAPAPGPGADAVRDALARLRALDGLISVSLVDPDTAQVLATVVPDGVNPRPDRVSDHDGGSGPTPVTSADRADNDGSDEGPGRRPPAVLVGAAATDVVQVISLMTATLGEPDEIEDVIVTLGNRHYLITPLPTSGVNGLLVVATLDRQKTNLALARRQLRTLGPLLLPNNALAAESGHVS